MFLMVGAIIILVSVFGGYIAGGGHLDVLWQPFEFIIICGAALGAFVIGNPKDVVVGALKSFGKLLKGSKHKKESYVELLCMLNATFKLAKTKGSMALETHIERPEDSALFQRFPIFAKDHHAMTFFCDFMRMLVMGADSAHEIEALMDQRIDVHHHEEMEIASAIQNTADAMPALGIVAAVLGVIHTMGSITEPPEVLGHLIGGALVGTFLGVWLSYGFIAPMAQSLKGVADDEVKYLICIKSGIIAYIQGYAPIMAVESARMVLKSHNQPSFQDIEAAIEATPPVAA
ncbi:MAG TPA: flagellar motor stator protein MotA [Stellaceae bacterium]|nr:flagellar motor stator protein MotA [Stellaceae bacterium]